MSDPAQAAEQARLRAGLARERASAALERVEELRRRHRGFLTGADLDEERARKLPGSGDEMAARRAQKRADAVHKREHRAG